MTQFRQLWAHPVIPNFKLFTNGVSLGKPIHFEYFKMSLSAEFVCSSKGGRRQIPRPMKGGRRQNADMFLLRSQVYGWLSYWMIVFYGAAADLHPTPISFFPDVHDKISKSRKTPMSSRVCSPRWGSCPWVHWAPPGLITVYGQFSSGVEL